MEAVISIVLSQRQRSIYVITEVADYGKGKKGKNLFFFQNSTMLQLGPLMYFTFWIIP